MDGPELARFTAGDGTSIQVRPGAVLVGQEEIPLSSIQGVEAGGSGELRILRAGAPPVAVPLGEEQAAEAKGLLTRLVAENRGGGEEALGVQEGLEGGLGGAVLEEFGEQEG